MHYVYFVGYLVHHGDSRAPGPYFNNRQVEIDYPLDGMEAVRKLQETLAIELKTRNIVVLGFTRLETA